MFDGATVLGMSACYFLALTALFILGAADNISVVIRQTVLQLLTPDSMRGRVTAVSVIFIGSSRDHDVVYLGPCLRKEEQETEDEQQKKLSLALFHKPPPAYAQ